MAKFISLSSLLHALKERRFWFFCALRRLA